MIKKSLIIIVLISLIIFGGCANQFSETFVTFEDTGNDVDNLLKCKQVTQTNCVARNSKHVMPRYDCSSSRLSDIGIVCDEGKCIC